MDDLFVLYDRASDSVWYPGEKTLDAVAGPRQGDAIEFLDKPAPLVLGQWLETHPDSTILLPTEEDFREMNRPFLGVRLEEQDDTLVITSVSEESPAAAAGFLNGDILRRFAAVEIENRDALHEIMLDFSAGETVDVVVEREGEELTLHPTLGSRSDP
jgi:predicted metalloprotease with PDZ domain